MEGEHLLSYCQFLSHTIAASCPALSLHWTQLMGTAFLFNLCLYLSVCPGPNITSSLFFNLYKLHRNTVNASHFGPEGSSGFPLFPSLLDRPYVVTFELSTFWTILLTSEWVRVGNKAGGLEKHFQEITILHAKKEQMEIDEILTVVVFRWKH